MSGFRKTIAVDFDGVIHSYENGWQDGVIYGNLVEGCKESLKHLSGKFDVVVFTARTELEDVQRACKEWGIDRYIVKYTNAKPPAALYIDDRAVRHVTWASSMAAVATLHRNGDL